MGKIVKFCSKCEESFDNKFSFCPNCAESLEAFEMKPVTNNETAKVEETPIVAASENIEVQKPETLPAAENESETVSSYNTGSLDEGILELDVEGGNGSGNNIEMPSENEASLEADSFETDEVETIVSTTPASKVDADVSTTPTNFFDEPVEKYGYRKIKPSSEYLKEAGDDFRITVIQEKNVKERNFLFLGAAALILTLTFAGLVYSIFDKNLDLAAIDGDSLVSLVPDLNEEPMEVEEPEKPKDEDKGGGGGGGGRDEQKPTSRGQLATQIEQPPMIAPTVTLVKKKSELQYQATTQGNRKIEQTNEKYGDPNSVSFDPSDGTGSGGGQGTGLGRGQGSGQGTGIGSGIGSGSGSGRGNGDGSGTGDSSGSGRERVAKDPPKPDPPKPAGPTSGLKILSKPRPGYTDAARQNNVQGTVTLRVTFLANGQIGSISPVSQLGYGLTEKAIAAARSMQFEPPLRNGVPYAVTKSVQFSFTIY